MIIWALHDLATLATNNIILSFSISSFNKLHAPLITILSKQSSTNNLQFFFYRKTDLPKKIKKDNACVVFGKVSAWSQVVSFVQAGEQIRIQIVSIYVMLCWILRDHKKLKLSVYMISYLNFKGSNTYQLIGSW